MRNRSGMWVLNIPFTATVVLMRHRKRCSPSSDAALQRRRLSWDWTFFCDFSPYPYYYKYFRFILSIICFLLANIKLNVEEVSNDIWKFDAKSDNPLKSLWNEVCSCIPLSFHNKLRQKRHLTISKQSRLSVIAQRRTKWRDMLVTRMHWRHFLISILLDASVAKLLNY